MQALRAILPQWFPRVNEIIRLIGSHNLLATPTMGELLDPELGPLVERYLRGAGEVTARQRIAVFRLAWDFAGSGLGSRIEQYERFYLAGRATCLRGAHGIAPKERAERLVSRFLAEESL
jgi:aromatic ring hydroxylase